MMIKRFFENLRLRLVYRGFLTPRQHPIYPSLLEITPVDTTVKSFDDLIGFINTLEDDYDILTALNILDLGVKMTRYPLKDWSATLIHHDSDFLRAFLRREFQRKTDIALQSEDNIQITL
jgi:hypothetical protein